jgi:hypothetical protein
MLLEVVVEEEAMGGVTTKVREVTTKVQEAAGVAVVVTTTLQLIEPMPQFQEKGIQMQEKVKARMTFRRTLATGTLPTLSTKMNVIMIVPL